MVNISTLQRKIENKVFKSLGSTYNLFPVVEGSVDKWGDQVEEYGGAVSVVVVPYSLYADRNAYNVFGDLKEGEVDIVFKHDQSISIDDKLVMNGVDFLIKQIEEFPLKNENLVKIARLVKKL